MPAKNSDGERATSTSTSRASNCSRRVAHEARPVRGAGNDLAQRCSSSGSRCTRRARTCRRARRTPRTRRAARGLNRIDFAQPSPAPSTSPYEKPPHATKPLNSASERRPAARSLMCTSYASKPARSNAAAISTWPLTPCSRRIATRGRAPARDERRGDRRRSRRTSARGARPGSPASSDAARTPASAASGLSRRRCIACVVDDHARCRSMRDSSSTTRRRPRSRMRVAGGRARRSIVRREPRTTRVARATLARRRRRTCTTAPSSSANSAASTSPSPGSATSRPQRDANAISASVTKQAAVGDIVIREQRCRRRAARCTSAKNAASRAGSSRSGASLPSCP